MVILCKISGVEHEVEATSNSLKISWKISAPDIVVLEAFSGFDAQAIFTQIKFAHAGVMEFFVEEGTLQIDQEKWVFEPHGRITKEYTKI